MKRIICLVLMFVLAITLGIIGFASDEDVPKATKISTVENTKEQSVTVTAQDEATDKETLTAQSSSVQHKDENQGVQSEITPTPAVSTLSAEDLAVKAEIAKHSNTKIVFRKEQKQNLFNKVYSLSFERVDDSSENRFKRVMYKTENGDKFGYNIDTGRLVEYFAVVKTVSDNITVSCADTRKIVEDFLSGEHEISEYLCEETVSGGRYYFQFYKEYQNYKTSDMISVSTDKNGNILSFNESEKSFDELNVLIDREEIIEKIKPLYEKYAVKDISLDYDEDGDLVALVKISYETEAGSSLGAVQIIKIE